MDTIGITMNLEDFSVILEESLKKPDMLGASFEAGECSVQFIIKYQFAETIIRKGRVDLILLEPKSDTCTNVLQSLLIGIHREKHISIFTEEVERSKDKVNVDQKSKDKPTAINQAPTFMHESTQLPKRSSVADPVLRQRKRLRGAKLLHRN
ncbi:unnamed protein product [Albugo candida]|uniref:Uncharacterized protein n=1 Tax=Albugo candida TaxID=65357 RepID=A0A024G5G9_9STRA|nr:unnamed protein product [Albugo candida]|eukprot:CCI41882.1 unnamed protein product [Albugo candida]